jgi:hypothetical protein
MPDSISMRLIVILAPQGRFPRIEESAFVSDLGIAMKALQRSHVGRQHADQSSLFAQRT